jgi:hypothetical protein
MLVRTTHSQKIPEIDHVKVSDLTKLNNDIYLLRLSYPEKIEKQIEVVKILKQLILVINRLLKLHNNATSMYLLILRTLKELQTSKLH